MAVDIIANSDEKKMCRYADATGDEDRSSWVYGLPLNKR